MAEGQKRKKAILLIRMTGIVIFLFILYRLQARLIVSILLDSRLYFIPAIILVYYCLLTLKLVRWISVFRFQGLRMGKLESLKAYVYSSLIAAVTFGQAMDILKAYSLKRFGTTADSEKKSSLTIGETGVSVVIERLMEYGLFMLFALVGVLFILGQRNHSNLLYSLLILIAIYTSMTYLFAFHSGKIFQFLDRQGERVPRMLNWLIRNLRGLLSGLHHYPARGLLFPLFLTLIYLLGLGLADFLLAGCLSIDIPYLHFIFISPFISIANMLPITVAGFGTRELAVIYCFSNYGISPERAIAFSLAYFSLSYLILLLLALLLFLPQFFHRETRAA